jgi:hypothetical protein
VAKYSAFRQPIEASLSLELERMAVQNEDKLSWAPAVANGTAIIALANLIGKVADPDAAFEAIQWPVAIFGVGLVAGMLGLHFRTHFYSWSSSQNMKVDALSKLIASNVAQVREKIKSYSLGGDRPKLGPSDELEAIQQALKEFRKSFETARRRYRVAELSNIISMCAVAVGLAFLLIGHWTGAIRLDGWP